MDFGFMERPNRAETQAVHTQQDAIVERLKQNSRTPWLDNLPITTFTLGGGTIAASITAALIPLKSQVWWIPAICLALTVLSIAFDAVYQAGRGQRGK